jgi:hypothetical protein
MLAKERKRLREVDSFTIIDYIKTSIEILMNMKMEENDVDKENNGTTSKLRKRQNKIERSGSSNVLISDTESCRSSADEPPKDYE